MKTAISIPDPMFRRADRLARRMRMSRSELYTRAIAGFVKSHESVQIREALDRVYETEASTLDAVLTTLQAEALDDEDW